MDMSKKSGDEIIAYLSKYIVAVLQDAGGQLTRQEIEDRICDQDDDIAIYASKISVSKKTGATYRKFAFKFNFAIKELSFVNILVYEKRNPIVSLTEKGFDIDVDKFDPMSEVVLPSRVMWDALKKSKKTKNDPENEDDLISDELGIEVRYNEEFKQKLLSAISNMTPTKFERFSRLLLDKMGVKFTDKGTQISHDGGIDGFGYHRDLDDFRTTKVVIQCKRYNKGPVREPEINQFLGAMRRNQADYGIFITNGKFTKAAREAALSGQPITLIDGDALVDLVKRYNVYVQPVTTYELLDFYNED